MSITNLSSPLFTFYKNDGTGDPLNGGKVYFYVAGTSTDKTVWQDSLKVTAHAQPVVLDAYGRSEIWFDGSYKIRIFDSADSLVDEIDTVTSLGGSSSTTEDTYNKVTNGSFETDADGGGVPDDWTLAPASGAVVAADTTDPRHGTTTLKFTAGVSGGGTATTTSFFEVLEAQYLHVSCSVKSGGTTVTNIVQIAWYQKDQSTLISTQDAYNNSGTSTTSWQEIDKVIVAPTNAVYAKLILKGSSAGSGTTWFDNISARQSLRYTQALETTGNVIVGGTIAVTGTSTLTGDTTVVGASDLQGSLQVGTPTGGAKTNAVNSDTYYLAGELINIIPYTVASASYASKSYDVSTQNSEAKDVALSSDGTKLYVLGGDDLIYQYTLSTAWDVSTASYASKSLDVSGEDLAPFAFAFGDSGTKLYMVGTTNDTVYQYTLTTAWDVSTASYASKSKSVASEEITPQGLFLGDSGTKMYVVGTTNDTVYRYTLSTGWDVSTAGATDQNFSVTSEDTAPSKVLFSSDGNKLHILGTTNNTVYQYTLSTAWDLTTASYTGKSFSVSGEASASNGLSFGDSGTKMYMSANINSSVFQYRTNLLQI